MQSALGITCFCIDYMLVESAVELIKPSTFSYLKDGFGALKGGTIFES